MNWYKKIKLAFPIITEPANLDTPVGQYKKFLHEGFNDIEIPQEMIMWFVDEDYNLHQVKSMTDQSHGDWDEFRQLPPKRWLASGRFSQDKDEATMSLDWKLRNNPHRYMYVRNKIEKILDRAFNNPTIRELY